MVRLDAGNPKVTKLFQRKWSDGSLNLEGKKNISINWELISMVTDIPMAWRKFYRGHNFLDVAIDEFPKELGERERGPPLQEVTGISFQNWNSAKQPLFFSYL